MKIDSTEGLHILLPLILFLSAIFWDTIWGNFSFETINNILSIIALYYFFLHCIEYFQSKQKKNDHSED